MTGEGTADQLERKGYKPIKAPENLIRAAEQYGVQTPGKILSADELSGRAVTDATPDAQAAVDLVWEWLERVGLTKDKAKPPVKCFSSILEGGVMLNGFYRDGTVFINSGLVRERSQGSFRIGWSMWPLRKRFISFPTLRTIREIFRISCSMWP